ncbi:MAG: hypothetical protein ABL933_09855 [Methyloglobulus sp.]|nr:hypothetical protein [Methyloglobulus sp.]
MVLDRRRHNGLKDMLDLLLSGFAEKVIAENGSPLEWLCDMVIASPVPETNRNPIPHLTDTIEILLPSLKILDA